MGTKDASLEAEIEITPVMIEAGKSAVLRALAGAEIYPPMTPSELAILVFREMSIASRSG